MIFRIFRFMVSLVFVLLGLVAFILALPTWGLSLKLWDNTCGKTKIVQSW